MMKMLQIFTVGDLRTWKNNDQFRYDEEPVQTAILRVNLQSLRSRFSAPVWTYNGSKISQPSRGAGIR